MEVFGADKGIGKSMRPGLSKLLPDLVWDTALKCPQCSSHLETRRKLSRSRSPVRTLSRTWDSKVQVDRAM